MDIVVMLIRGQVNSLITHTNTAFALIKLDTNGVLQFAKKIECTVSTGDLRFWKLKPDRYGNINIIGDYDETVDFDPGPGIYAPPSVAGGNTFLARYDLNGDFVFMKPFTGSTGNNLIVPSYLDEEGRGCLAMISKGNIFYDGTQLNGNPLSNWYSVFAWLITGNVIQHFFRCNEPCQYTFDP
ncbi:MAG: hypothetical protein IPP71_00025 [Bacteroidetes bacterium]|nr:hypothetical protein [Bacteroidota bacterium]